MYQKKEISLEIFYYCINNGALNFAQPNCQLLPPFSSTPFCSTPQLLS